MTEDHYAALVGLDLLAGLGNQMFQYAAGLALAERLGAELRCDGYDYTKPDMRPLGLHEFGITWTECRTPRARGTLCAIARFFAPVGGTPFAKASISSRNSAASTRASIS